MMKEIYIHREEVKGPKIELNNDIQVIEISCGDQHLMSLSDKNQVIAYGNNKFNQSSVISNEIWLTKPRIWDKNKELGLRVIQYAYY